MHTETPKLLLLINLQKQWIMSTIKVPDNQFEAETEDNFTKSTWRLMTIDPVKIAAFTRTSSLHNVCVLCSSEMWRGKGSTIVRR